MVHDAFMFSKIQRKESQEKFQYRVIMSFLNLQENTRVTPGSEQNKCYSCLACKSEELEAAMSDADFCFCDYSSMHRRQHDSTDTRLLCACRSVASHARMRNKRVTDHDAFGFCEQL